MIPKHHILTLTIAFLVIALGLTACASSIGTNSESASRIAELEAQVRQLESENRQLTQELQDIRNLVASPSYTNTLSNLTEAQSNSSDLSAFVHGLPDLPALPPGITPNQIDNAINTALSLRATLKALPPPPLPLGPWKDLDDKKNKFIQMTVWMEDLQPLPEFLQNAESLEDLKSRIEGYLQDTQSTASAAASILEQVRNTTS